jgi:hypothetical protein
MKTFATVRTYKVDFKLQFAKNESNNNFFASRVVFHRQLLKMKLVSNY